MFTPTFIYQMELINIKKYIKIVLVYSLSLKCMLITL